MCWTENVNISLIYYSLIIFTWSIICYNILIKDFLSKFFIVFRKHIPFQILSTVPWWEIWSLSIYQHARQTMAHLQWNVWALQNECSRMLYQQFQRELWIRLPELMRSVTKDSCLLRRGGRIDRSVVCAYELFLSSLIVKCHICILLHSEE